MFDFAETTKDMTANEILNYYRNLYYAEPQVTGRGIIANAINDYFADVVPKSEVEELKKAYLQYEETSGLKQAKQEVAREIFDEIGRLLELYTINKPFHMPFNYIDILFVHFVAELKKKYTEESENDNI